TTAGSPFTRLTLAAGTRYALNHATTAWGSLAGSGDIFTGAAGTPTMIVGFAGTSSTFSGRLVAFTDAAYPFLTKVGSGVLTLNTAQDANASWGATTVNGGSIFYTGAGKAFQSASAASAGVFNVNVGGVLQLDNVTSAENNRLGLASFGTLNLQGGRFLVSGNASTAVTEGVTNLNMTNGGGRVELSAPGAGLRLSVGTLSGGNNTGSMVIAGITGNATGAGVVNLSVDNPSYVGLAQQGGGLGGVFTANGSTDMIVRGDILADANALGQGTGFLVRDTLVISNAVTTNNSAVISVPSTAGIVVGATVTSNSPAIPAKSLVTAVDSLANTITISSGTGVAPATRDLTVGNYFRALADNELNYLSGGALGWRQAQNAGVFASQTAAQTVGVDTVVNTLTFSGATTSLGSSLGTAFGRFAQGGRLLTQEFRGATGFLVKAGTANINVGSFTSNTGVTLFGHVLTGATANVNSTFGLNQTSGFVKTGGGTLNINGLAYFTGGTFTVNGGTVNLNSGFDNTVALTVRADSTVASNLQVNASNAVLDLKNKSQAFGSIASANGIAGGAGTITNTGASIVNLVSTAGGTFSGTIAGNLNFVRMGNNTTTLTNAQTFTGEAVVRGGTLLLQDAGTLAASAVRAFYGTVNLENFGLNPSSGSLPVRIPPAAPITLQGSTLQVGGTGSTDTVVTFNRINLEAGANALNPQPYISVGGTVRVNVGNIVRTAANRPTLNMVGWTQRNSSGGTNTLGQQGLSANSNVFFTQINSVAFTESNVVNGLIGGWAVASGDTFAGYSDTFGVTQMGQANAVGFTGTDVSTGNAATGNYNNDGADRTMPSGARVASSWRLVGAAHDITFAGGATGTNLTLGAGIVTNGNAQYRLVAQNAADSVTGAASAQGGDGNLYFFINQNTTVVQPRITGPSGVVSFGGATFRLEPNFASNDYTGGTFANGGTLSLNASAGLTAVPSGQRWFSAATIGATTTTVQLATVAGLSVGSTFVNANFPAGTTVTAIDVPTNTVTLSAASTNATAATSQVIRSNALNASLANFVGLTIHNSTVSMVGDVAGQIDPATNVVINGGGRLVFNNFSNMVAGTDVVQSLRSIVFNNEGGAGNADVDIGNPNDYVQGATPNFSILVLTGDSPVTATNNNLATTPTIYATDAARTRLQFSAASPVITVNAGLAPTGLRILSAISQNASMTGPIVKAGAGGLALTSQDSTFTTGFDLSAGSLIIGVNSDLTNAKGPLGTGTLTVRAGTSLFSDNTVRTLQNAVTVDGNFEFGGRLVGSGLTLSGPVSLGTSGRTISITHPNVVSTLSGTVTSTAGAGFTGLTKSGEGTLALSGALSFGGAGISVTGGVLRTTLASILPAASPVAISAGAGLDVFGTSQTVETVTGTGFITNSQPVTGLVPALTVGGASHFTFGGVIADNAANLLTLTSRLDVVKEGASVMTLTQPQGYVGTTTINAGVISLTDTAHPGSGNVVFGSGLNPELRLARNDAFTLPNVIEQTGLLSMTGTGTGTLTGNSVSFNGTLAVNAGTITIGDGATNGSIGNASVAMGGGTLRFNRTDGADAPLGGLSLVGTLSGTGTLVQAGTGTTTLAPTSSTFSGSVAVNAGRLFLNSTDALGGASTITVAAGARVVFNVDQALGNGSLNRVAVTSSGILETNAASVQLGILTVNGGSLIGTPVSLGGSFAFNDAVNVLQDVTFSAEGMTVGTPLSSGFNVAAGKLLTVNGTIIDDGFVGATTMRQLGA
ncbi:MAG: beta strand repeat-containing protein, partial [Opitutia bacterium]